MPNANPVETSLSAISLIAKQLREEKHFDEILCLYKEKVHKQFQMDEIAQNQWLLTHVTFALRRLNKHWAARQFIQGFKTQLQDVLLPALKNELGWNLIHLLKNTENCPDSSLISIKNEAYVLLSTLQPETDLLLWSKLFSALTDSKIAVRSDDWLYLAEIAFLVKPDLLSDQTYDIHTSVKGRDKDIELASDREKWYAATSRMLFLCEKYAECCQICEDALGCGLKLHHANELWFARRIALCLRKMGEYESAILKMETIAAKKKDWFILKEIAELYADANNFKKALEFAARAALSFGGLEFKVKLFDLMAELILKTGNKRELAEKHLLLADLIRKENGWALKNQIDGISDKKENSNKIANELKTKWSNWAGLQIAEEGSKEGTIKKILHGGPTGDGLIADKEGRMYYFKTQMVLNNQIELKEGMLVSFRSGKNTNPQKKYDLAKQIKLQTKI